MAMKRCPVCGEKYSDTYKSCPFCEEEEALRQGGQIRRGGGRGGRRAAGRQQQPNLLSPILIAIIVLLACLLLYLLFGDKIAERLGGDKDPVTPPPVEDVTPPAGDGDTQEPPAGGVMPGDGEAGETEPPAEPEKPSADPSALPETLTMAYLGSPRKEFTMAVGDDPIPLTASGGSGSYTWQSSDDGIASVDQTGKVTAISVGRAVLTVYDDAGKGTCTVLVKAGAGGQTAAPQPTTGSDSGSGGAHKLNNTDFTRSIQKEGPYQLTVSGVTTAITWTSSDPGVATVSDKGLVTPVSPGVATVTASWDGQSLECIVRVNP